MAVKFKEDKNNEFKSVDRDIREHKLNDHNFDLSFTDSTCPFEAMIDEIKQPGEEYYFALNASERINRLLAKGWYIVSPDRLKNKRAYRKDLREEADSITTGDTILLARDERYGIKEREHYEKKAVTIMKDTLQRVNTDAYNPILPFSDKAYSSKGERV
jgi:hypothetical protein